MLACPIELTKTLIKKKSITPEDDGCLELLETLLRTAHFQCERLDAENVKNLFASYGNSGPLFIFLGHIDVVPTGPEQQWRSPPFTPTETEGYLYGRGAADMKSAVAAMVTALTQFIHNQPLLPFRVGILLTSDEEGVAQYGTRHVMHIFKERNIKIDYCLVGEPSSNNVLGDTIKIGRRGTLSGQLTILGKQGHIAYPHLADNPIHRFAKALVELTEMHWDHGNEYFQATQCQFSNICAGTGANNVIPGSLSAAFNFRFSTDSTPSLLQETFESVLKKYALHYEITWQLGGQPFLTTQGALLKCTQQAVRQSLGISSQLSTQGGTSDGRFVAPTGAEVIELGLVNQTIHQINECVKMADITKLAEIYLRILTNLHATLKKPL